MYMKLIDALIDILYEEEIVFLNAIITESQQLQLKDESKKLLQDIGMLFGRGYTKWLVVKLTQGLLKEEDIYKYKEYFKYFEKGRKLNIFTYNDIFKYQNPNQFAQEAINAHDKIIGFEQTHDVEDPKYIVSLQQIQKLENVGIRFLGVTSGGFQCFIIPKNLSGNKEAFETQRNILGRCQGREQGALIEICTFASQEHFDSYLQSDDLFIFFNMKDPSSPYQLHFDSSSFMDKNDNQLDDDDDRLNQFLKFIDSKKMLPLEKKMWFLFEELTPEEIKFIFSREDLKMKYFNFKIHDHFNQLTPEEIKYILHNKELREKYYTFKILNKWDQLTPEDIKIIINDSETSIKKKYFHTRIMEYFEELTPEEIKIIISSQEGGIRPEYFIKKIKKQFNQLTSEEIEILLFFNSRADDMGRIRAYYFNALTKKGNFISVREFDKTINLGIAYIEDSYLEYKLTKTVFINTKGEKDVTGIDIDNITNSEYIKAYFNTISPIHFHFIDKFDKYFEGLATASLSDNYYPDIFINQQGKLDVTGIDFESCPDNLKSTYLNTKFGFLLFNDIRKSNILPHGIYLATDQIGRQIFINSEGKPYVSGIDPKTLDYNMKKTYDNTINSQQGKTITDKYRPPYGMSYRTIK